MSRRTGGKALECEAFGARWFSGSTDVQPQECMFSYADTKEHKIYIERQGTLFLSLESESDSH